MLAAEDLDPTPFDKVQTQNAWYAVGVCDCTHIGDPSRDDVMTVVDVSHVVNVAFRNGTNFWDNCPHALTDLNADGVTSVTDVGLMVNMAFRNGNPATLPDACTP